ncbi:Cytochrome P450 CYP4/CYP19/CYP26 subfamily [Handroanthus impetiginosus]|uniref:Cytochrome P450 CYP4/CYP19/CYP26 subfamily n=1 Tax=Handroanthus impetiginosus TaxID=429701 RepID=A0A2G9FYF7_9LAMI|nr:Cytochrome P450 CYP4/CYP19/CYP26 subfamily [Handroanthus impetiginosus]
MYAGILFVILYIIFIYYKKFYVRKEKSSLPTYWPIFGMMHGMLLNRGRIHQFLTEILKQSGGTLLFKGPWFTNMDMLITSDPANVHYILTKNFANFPKGPEFKKIFDVLGDGIFAAESESWVDQRRTIKSLVNHTSYQDYVATTSWNKVETALIPILELVSEMGMEVDMQELFQRLAFDCSCMLIIGHDPTSLCIDLPHLPHEKAFADAEEAILYRHILPKIFWKLQSWLHIGKEGKFRKGKKVVDQFLSHFISLKQQNLKRILDQNATLGWEDFDLLTGYMRVLAEKGCAPNISDEFWKDLVLNLITAGKDTISAALTWFFWLLATNPAEEEKIRQEILTYLPSMKEVGKWRFPNREELKNLIYLHGALCESLRLFPPIPFQHKAPLEQDVLPSGHRINPNTKAVLSFFSMGRMESIWGKDCLEFKPGRWISESGCVKVEPSSKFATFNAGPRSCLGKEMSFVQLKIVAAAIISRFNIRVKEGHSVSPSTSVVLHMKHGLMVKVSKRV